MAQPVVRHKIYSRSSLLIQVTIRHKLPDGKLGDPLDVTGATFEAALGLPGSPRGPANEPLNIGGLVTTTAEQQSLGTVLIQFPPWNRKGVAVAELRMMLGDPSIPQTVWREEFEVIESVYLD